MTAPKTAADPAKAVVQLKRAGGTAVGPNIMDCRVRERRFSGEVTELDLVISGSDASSVLRCRLPTSLASGDAIRVAIAPADVRIFPAESA